MLDYLKIFFMSMLPLVELRGAALYSQYLELPLIPSYLVCIIGNLVPVPLIYYFARRVLNWGSDKPGLGRFCKFLHDKGESAGRKLTERTSRGGTFVALMLFVGIPLPGTGAWTGTLAASILDLGPKHTFGAVTLGLFMAGAIMLTAGYLGFNLI